MTVCLEKHDNFNFEKEAAFMASGQAIWSGLMIDYDYAY